MRLAWVRGNWSSRGPPPGPGWRNPSPWRTIPPPMSLLAFLLVAQTATQDTVRPYLAFPEPGLDDPAAYEGYATRVYQDASHNAFQVYLKGNTGRVVNLWADAANESVGFTVRDSSGRPAELAWGSSGAVVARSAQTRSVSYALELPSAVRVSLFLLGSMRVERDLQYAARDTPPPGDTRETVPALSGSPVTIRRPAGGPVRLTVRITTDAPALTPLGRAEIFNDEFHRFSAQVRADTAHPLRFRRLEREVRGVELLCYREKLMAGLPNFATYFGRDMLMTALLMQPVWTPAMSEHVVASALGKLSPTGDVSHEEALGGQAIRENAAEYNRLVSAGQLARARALLAHLAATRENYIMVDDDFQLPVVAARYLADPRVPADRKRDFLRTGQQLERLLSNLAFVVRKAAPYARDRVATNLVSFPRAPDGHWVSASWRDSRAGYGGGRFAMDVNVIWVPHALEAVGAILYALNQNSVTPVIREQPLAAVARDRAALQRAVTTWKGAERHFLVALARKDVSERVAARLRWLPPAEGEYWNNVAQRTGAPADTLRFLALSLDGAGRPIPIVNTDPAMLLLVDSLGPDRTLELIGPIMLPYPWGLFVDGLGPVVANDAYATRDVWEAFRRDRYHSPTVVWGRDVNALLAGLARAMRNAKFGMRNDSAVVDSAFHITDAVDHSGLRHAELWSYAIENGRLVPSRYGTSSDVRLC